MPSQKLASGENLLKGELAAAWNILEGSSGDYTDLGIARRFGGSAGAYSLRDIGAMNGRVVNARRSEDDLEENFSANQVQSGALENWVNGKLESTLPADVATAAAAYSLRKVKASYSGNAVRIRRSSDDAEVNVAFDLDDKVSTSSSISVVSGTVTDTTLGDFISGTDAFVHTWYDQAGSNNAVQATDANQPKIAENGALLADGVSFNGDFFLQKITTDTTTAASIFGVHTKGTATGSGARPIGYQESTSAGTNSLAFAIDNSIRFDGAAATTSTQTIPTSGLFLATTIKVSNTEANNFLNSVSNIADNSLTLNDTDVRFTLGFASTTPDYSYDGSIKEAIFYNSDQSNNRFKIESNINNYYNLYNDENEADGVWIAASGSLTGVDTITGYDGTGSAERLSFRATSTGGNKTCGLILNKALASGDDLFVSFNLKINSGTPSITIRSSSTTTAEIVAENFVTLVEGFNSYQFNIDTAASAPFLAIQDSVVFDVQLKDLKISRIARNGFVETWYDQSGNGNDATQGTASNQPAIIQNGGINSDGLLFDGINDVLVSTSFSATQPITTSAVFKSSNTSDSQTVIGGVNYNFLIHRAGGAATAGLNAGTLYAPFSSITTKQLMTTLANGASSTVSQNGVISSTGNAGTGDQTDLGIGSNGNGGTAGSGSAKFDGSIEEVIVFDSDKTSDRTEIEKDIANYYNITLS